MDLCDEHPLLLCLEVLLNEFLEQFQQH